MCSSAIKGRRADIVCLLKVIGSSGGDGGRMDEISECVVPFLQPVVADGAR